MGKPVRSCCSSLSSNKPPDVELIAEDGGCNGNSVHSEELPGIQAVRQHFHNNGASAGICVEDLHEGELSRKRSKECRPCTFSYQYRHKKTGEDGEKKGQNPEYTDFWKLLHGKHSAFEAMGLSGAIALCVELSHYNYIGKFQRTEENRKEGCLLRKLTNSIHTLGGPSFSSVNRLLPEGTSHEDHTTNQTQSAEGNPLQKERNPIEARQQSETEHPSVCLSYCEPSTESLKAEQRFDFYDHQSNNKTRRDEDTFEHGTTNKAQTNDSIHADTSLPLLSIEEAFAEFEEICKKYTAIGKGIMGNQAAMRGNMKSAASLWKEATSLGHPKSYYNLALCYEDGRGVKQNFTEAIRLYKHAVKEGHLQAMYNLAMLYMEGTEQSQKDINRAIRLLKVAADQGLVEAQKYLGVYFTEEHSEDPEKATQFMKMAADQQDAESQYFLAMFYEHGYGVQQNTCKAGYLYNKAAESGHADAMYSLALYHLDGIGGLPQDSHCAKRLLTKSADQGNAHAQKKLEELNKVNSTDKETYHITKNKYTSDVSHLLKLSTSVSSPCLSELVCESFRQVKDQVMYNPVSGAGTVSQIYTQLIIPRGMTLTDESDWQRDPESDTGAMFQIGDDCGTFDREGDFQDGGVYFEHVNEVDGVKSKFEHSASMPDMMMLTCV